jgi:seryl-tRNA synthetase
MNKQNAREYFSKAYRIDHRIRSKFEQLESLNALATRATSTLSAMPRNPNRSTSTMADVIARIIDLQEEINQDIIRLVDSKREIMTIIKSIENSEYQTLLEKRYLCFLTWEKIAVDMSYTIHHLYKMHNAALEVCSKILNQDT